jgi:phenylpropionate dioxygenase-like ring-hydroxylating dioxygenase large terminal subunit
LGDFAEICGSRFGDGWRESLAQELDYNVNWKIPIENSLEAYHIPCVHPDTFRQYPGSERSQHILLPHRTAFGTALPFSAHSRIDRWFQNGEGWLMRRLNLEPTGEYWQHHIFPNLLFSFTDAISLCHCVIPTGPRSSHAVVRQYGRTATAASPLRNGLAWAWGRVTAGITRRIMQEDIQLFSDLQRGLDASPNLGLLGACEERIHAFQQFVVEHCDKPAAVASALSEIPS